MRPEDVEAALDRAEQALNQRRGLKGTGFWQAVRLVRRESVLADRYADRIGAIDRRAFERGVRLRVPLVPGLIVLAAGVAFGVVALVFAVGWGSESEQVLRVNFEFRPLRELPARVPVVFLIGFAAVLICSHSLTHWLVGRAVGMRFTHVFLGGPPPPRPGVKTDYASYLRVAPRARALMHASGAVVSKIVPFALLSGSLRLYDGWPWLTWILIGVGVLTLVTDAVFSTKTSDWMKVRRELRAARS